MLNVSSQGRRWWSKENKINLGTLLTYLISILVFCRDNVSNEFENFNDLLYRSMETCCPVQTIRKKIYKYASKIKYNADIVALSELKRKLYALYKETGSKKHKSSWNKANKNLKRKLYKLKKSSYDSYVSSSKNKSKAVWNVIKAESESSQASLIESVKYGNDYVTNSYDIANLFNKFFSEHAATLSTSVNIPSAMTLLKEAFSSSSMAQFSFKPITLEDLRAVMNGLKTSRLDKYGNIPTHVLKENFHIIGQPLLRLINDCISNGVFPDFMKKGVITPLFKKGKREIVSNYRPISILPSLAKVFERVLYNQLYHHFEQNGLLDAHQFGFRKKRSTIQAIQQLLENIYSALESKNPALSIHFDLAKAFDTINHKLLLQKLKFYGLDELSVKLL